MRRAARLTIEEDEDEGESEDEVDDEGESERTIANRLSLANDFSWSRTSQGY